MLSEGSNKIRSPSQINYDYQTIRITKSRIDKGLLAIPISLSEFFPTTNRKVKLFLDEEDKSQLNNFSSYKSSTNESRIGGLKDWFDKNGIKDGEELVIHIVDRKHFIYRLIPEKLFVSKINQIQNRFDETEKETEAEKDLEKLGNLTQTSKNETCLNEYLRLLNNADVTHRKTISKNSTDIYENTPNNIRTLLGKLHRGLCQVCRFTFLKKDRMPYYEIHHLNPNLGHHPKNLILVCANCHRQFEYSDVRTFFNENGWLIEVCFNESKLSVNQPILNENQVVFKKTVHI